MSEEGWEKNEKFVLGKLDEHGEAIERQQNINQDQSKFNHEIEKSVTSIKEKLGWAVAGISVFWTIAGDYIKGLFK